MLKLHISRSFYTRLCGNFLACEIKVQENVANKQWNNGKVHKSEKSEQRAGPFSIRVMTKYIFESKNEAIVL